MSHSSPFGAVSGSIRYSVIINEEREKVTQCFAEGEARGADNGYLAVVDALIKEVGLDRPSQKSYHHERYSFNYIVDEDAYCYLCVADKNFPTRICFAFLSRIAGEYTRGSRYKATMRSHMDYFSNNAGADKIRNIQAEVDQVREIMQQNIDDVLHRGERLEKLQDDAERLEQSANVFKKGAGRLKRTMYCRNIKLTLAIVGIIVAILFFIIVIACGGFKFPKC